MLTSKLLIKLSSSNRAKIIQYIAKGSQTHFEPRQKFLLTAFGLCLSGGLIFLHSNKQNTSLNKNKIYYDQQNINMLIIIDLAESFMNSIYMNNPLRNYIFTAKPLLAKETEAKTHVS
jgi:hypothetical protein